ncbi:hypothetical protein C3L33_16225, partial [Rhododendron williamsianum]
MNEEARGKGKAILKVTPSELPPAEEIIAGCGGDDLYKELWKACAGPLVDVPRFEERVVYFPQGPVEQVKSVEIQIIGGINKFGTESESSTLQSSESSLTDPLQSYGHSASGVLSNWLFIANLSFCLVPEKVLETWADSDTDEVYACITLLPEQDQSEPTSPDSYPPEPLTPMLKSFCKVLTASDIIGGFSVPLRHANECLPALLVSQRHFNSNEFVSSRGENGELRVGVRRAARQQSTMPSSVISIQSMHLGLQVAASQALAQRTLFFVCNMPRTSQFIVGLNKYLEAVNDRFRVGMRFKMRFEGEDCSLRIFTGTIVGVEDLSAHWENSKWRSLRVRWDEAASIPRPERVSPWEIVPIVLLFGVDLRNPPNAR